MFDLGEEAVAFGARGLVCDTSTCGRGRRRLLCRHCCCWPGLRRGCWCRGDGRRRWQVKVELSYRRVCLGRGWRQLRAVKRPVIIEYAERFFRRSSTTLRPSRNSRLALGRGVASRPWSNWCGIDDLWVLRTPTRLETRLPRRRQCLWFRRFIQAWLSRDNVQRLRLQRTP